MQKEQKWVKKGSKAISNHLLFLVLRNIDSLLPTKNITVQIESLKVHPVKIYFHFFLVQIKK